MVGSTRRPQVKTTDDPACIMTDLYHEQHLPTEFEKQSAATEHAIPLLTRDCDAHVPRSRAGSKWIALVCLPAATLHGLWPAVRGPSNRNRASCYPPPRRGGKLVPHSRAACRSLNTEQSGEGVSVKIYSPECCIAAIKANVARIEVE